MKHQYNPSQVFQINLCIYPGLEVRNGYHKFMAGLMKILGHGEALQGNFRLMKNP